MQHYSLLCVGAVYQDVILHVPRFPREDSKLRATSRTVRVGGNIINLLRVFKQVRETTNVTYQLGLLCSMGEGSGEGIRVVQSIEEEIGVKVGYKLREGIGISTAYVAEDTEGKGRSIISWSEAPDLTQQELGKLLREYSSQEFPNWLHIEGRNCLEIGRYLENLLDSDRQIIISIDFEKPSRVALWELVRFTDVAFFSMNYASGIVALKENTPKLETVLSDSIEAVSSTVQKFLKLASSQLRPWAVGYVLAGEYGSFLFFRNKCRFPIPKHSATGTGSEIRKLQVEILDPDDDGNLQLYHLPAIPIAKAGILETVGAGDTFIAAVIFGLSQRMNVVEAGKLGNRIAGRKCLQVGHEGVWIEE